MLNLPSVLGLHLFLVFLPALAQIPPLRPPTPRNDLVVDSMVGQVLCFDEAPPLRVEDTTWYSSHRLAFLEEGADGAWTFHVQGFFQRPAEGRIKVVVLKHLPLGGRMEVRQWEVQVKGSPRTLAQRIVLPKVPPVEHGVVYSVVMSQGAVKLAEGSLRLVGRLRNDSATIPESKATAEAKPKVETPSPVAPPPSTNPKPMAEAGAVEPGKPGPSPFDPKAVEEAITRLNLRDFARPTERGARLRVFLRFAARTGAVISLRIDSEPGKAVSSATKNTVIRRCRQVRVKPFAGSDRVVEHLLVL